MGAWAGVSYQLKVGRCLPRRSADTGGIPDNGRGTFPPVVDSIRSDLNSGTSERGARGGPRYSGIDHGRDTPTKETCWFGRFILFEMFTLKLVENIFFSFYYFCRLSLSVQYL